MFVGMASSIVEAVRTSGINISKTHSDVLLVIHLIIWCIMYLMALIFFIQLYQEQITSFILLISTILFALHVSFGILWIYSDTMTSGLQWSVMIVWDITYATLGMLIFGFGAFVHYKIYKLTKEYQGMLIGCALCLLVAGFFLGLLNDFGVPGNLGLFGEIMKILGIFVFVFLYVFQIDYIFRIPFQINTVMLFNQFGMLIYAAIYKIREDQKDSISMDLITAAISGFSTFMSETIGSEEPLKRVETGDKILIVEHGKKSTIAIISDNSNFFLKQSMKEVIRTIECKYEKPLDVDYMDSSFFSDIPKFLVDSFPYLGLPAAETY